jgi:hypothetical protein
MENEKFNEMENEKFNEMVVESFGGHYWTGYGRCRIYLENIEDICDTIPGFDDITRDSDYTHDRLAYALQNIESSYFDVYEGNQILVVSHDRGGNPAQRLTDKLAAIVTNAIKARMEA